MLPVIAAIPLVAPVVMLLLMYLVWCSGLCKNLDNATMLLTSYCLQFKWFQVASTVVGTMVLGCFYQWLNIARVLVAPLNNRVPTSVQLLHKSYDPGYNSDRHCDVSVDLIILLPQHGFVVPLIAPASFGS